MSAGFSEAPLGVRAAPGYICALSFLCSPRGRTILVHAVKADDPGDDGHARERERKKKTHCDVLMTHLSELGPGFLLLHSTVGHQIIEYFS